MHKWDDTSRHSFTYSHETTLVDIVSWLTG